MAQYNKEPLHPESYQQLRQLVKLHGVTRVLDAIYDIQREKEIDSDGKTPIKAGRMKEGDLLPIYRGLHRNL